MDEQSQYLGNNQLRVGTMVCQGVRLAERYQLHGNVHAILRLSVNTWFLRAASALSSYWYSKSLYRLLWVRLENLMRR